MPLVREHRGGLSESMETVREVKDRAELVQIIMDELRKWHFEVTPEMVTVEPYGYDERIDWDTYLITIAGYGVWGYAKGPLNFAPESRPARD